MSGERHALTAPLWRWTGGNGGSWFFLPVKGEAAEALAATALIHRLESGKRGGFGAVRVTVGIGATEWQTSAFPHGEEGWIVPVKAAVRKAEALSEDEPIAFTLTFA